LFGAYDTLHENTSCAQLELDTDVAVFVEDELICGLWPLFRTQDGVVSFYLAGYH
jgi:hypothetical protein